MRSIKVKPIDRGTGRDNDDAWTLLDRKRLVLTRVPNKSKKPSNIRYDEKVVTVGNLSVLLTGAPIKNTC
jgi:hypothetical protein